MTTPTLLFVTQVALFTIGEAPWSAEQRGGLLDEHPWTQGMDLEVAARDHPATAHLGPTGLGHFPAAWESPNYLWHLAGGLRWTLGATP